ncbi:MAG: DUF3696 domain-containing protein [Candidatus Magnetominusculus sp. LBB02]|nr:DUF3696 domain-containing protein [Candidatus Magnetominusculus sp. LBB02]
MLKKLRIQNFKIWKDTGTINMAPITLFFGANSSGKSSIGQFLMMLKQTIESPSSDRKTVFYPGGKNSAVQLGSYNEMVYQRDNENKIMFEYQWDSKFYWKNIIQRYDKSEFYVKTDTLSFQAEVGLAAKEKHYPFVNRLNYWCFKENKSQISLGIKRTPALIDKYEVMADVYLQKYENPILPPGYVTDFSPDYFYGFPDDIFSIYQDSDIFRNLNLEHKELFNSFCYLGPIRGKPDRLFIWHGNAPESVGYDGENTIAAMLAAGNRDITSYRLEPGHGYRVILFEEMLSQKLKKMGLIDDFKVTPIAEHRHEYEVKIKTRGSNYYVDIPDVGFGVSQVLPVLVQCFYAPVGSIIIIEQPEIHLHPSAQSALADVFIDVINSRENGVDRNIQLIIETHSEHFLRRLQRRIAEATLPKEQVAAYFANTNSTPAVLEPLDVDEYGNIKNWPDNFFGDEMGDITAQSMAAMTRRMKQETGDGNK